MTEIGPSMHGGKENWSGVPRPRERGRILLVAVMSALAVLAGDFEAVAGFKIAGRCRSSPTCIPLCADSLTLRAGAFAADITPEFPISMNGGMTDRSAKFAHDRLHARCLVLDNGRLRIAIVICDSCMIPRTVVDAAKERASRSTGIATSHMLIAATHTHTAPTVGGAFQSEPDEKYREFLVGRIAEAIAQAVAQLEPARIGWAVGTNPTQVFNRRWHMKPGTIEADPFGKLTDQVKMNPSRASVNLDRPAGPIDPDVSIISVQSRAGRPIALLANYSLHYVGGPPADAVSADYFGQFAEEIKARLDASDVKPPFVGILSNGTSGNINNINFRVPGESRKPFEQIRIVAASVADTAFDAFRRIEHRDWAPLAMREKDVELGVRRPSREDIARAREILAKAKNPILQSLAEIYARETVLLSDYPSTVMLKLQALRIGQVGIVAIPCEVFVEIGLEIKRASPFPTTFTIELANGYNGYLPTPEHHRLGGYETWRARSSYLEANAAIYIERTIQQLLREAEQGQ